jgi:hypothetical protein
MVDDLPALEDAVPSGAACATMSPVPFVVVSVALFLLRRLRPTTVVLIAYRTWRRLPPEQRQQIILAARRNGPRLASSLTRRGRPRF